MQSSSATSDRYTSGTSSWLRDLVDVPHSGSSSSTSRPTLPVRRVNVDSNEGDTSKLLRNNAAAVAARAASSSSPRSCGNVAQLLTLLALTAAVLAVIGIAIAVLVVGVQTKKSVDELDTAAALQGSTTAAITGDGSSVDPAADSVSQLLESVLAKLDALGSASKTPSHTHSGTRTAVATQTATLSAAATQTVSRTAPVTQTVSGSASVAPSATSPRTLSNTAAVTQTMSVSAPATQTMSVSAPITQTLTATPLSTPSSTPSISHSGTAAVSSGLSHSATPSQALSESSTASATASATPSSSGSVTASRTASESATMVPSPSETASSTASPTATASVSLSSTVSVSHSATPTASVTASGTASPTSAPTCSCCNKCANVSDTPSACSCCMYCSVEQTCANKASYVLQSVQRDLVLGELAGAHVPADATVAVGSSVNGGRIMVAANARFAILKKTTRASILEGYLWELFAAGNDESLLDVGGGTRTYHTKPQLHWDVHSSRFVGSAVAMDVLERDTGLQIVSPSAVAGVYASTYADQGPTRYNVTGNTVVVSPSSGCTTFTTPVTGKIAVIRRGTCTFYQKMTHAQAGGAVAVIFTQSGGEDDLEYVTMNTTVANPINITIPAILVGDLPGTRLLANNNANVRVFAPRQRLSDYETRIRVTVSTTGTPSTLDDFRRATRSHYGVFLDTPRTSISEDAIFFSSSPITQPEYGQVGTDLTLLQGAHVIALDKTILLTNNIYTNIWNWTQSNVQALYPVQPLDAIVSTVRPMFFVHLVPGTAGVAPFTHLRVRWAHRSGMNASYVDIALPENFYDYMDGRTYGGRQPVELPDGLGVITARVSSAVVRGNSLWLCYTRRVTYRQFAIRWHELDVTHVMRNGSITQRQYGDINLGADVDTYYGSLVVTEAGHMAMGFMYSGKAHNQSIAYTVRLANDETGSTRSPPQYVFNSSYAYFENYGGTGNRVGEYTGMAIDPSTGEIYGYAQHPDPDGLIFPTGIARDWSTALYSFSLNATCPIDGSSNAPYVAVDAEDEPDGGLVIITESLSDTEYEVPAEYGRPRCLTYSTITGACISGYFNTTMTE